MNHPLVPPRPACPPSQNLISSTLTLRVGRVPSKKTREVGKMFRALVTMQKSYCLLGSFQLVYFPSPHHPPSPTDSFTHPRSQVCPVGRACPSTGPDTESWMEAQILSSHHGNRHQLNASTPYPHHPSLFSLPHFPVALSIHPQDGYLWH